MLQLTLAVFTFLLCSSCSEPYLGVKVPFVATWGGEPIHCEDSDIALSDLRFYVSTPALIDLAGKSLSLELHADLPWQQHNLALLDLENGKGGCLNGSGEVYSYLVGSLPPGTYRGLRFTVGVPFDRNHANPLKAEAPLDDAAMHWHWRSGYKFFRAGVTTPDDGFWLHVGSAGCEGTTRSVSGCRFPNRVVVELDEFVPGEDVVEIDLKALFEATNLSDSTPEDCSSGPAESACAVPFAALGIDFATGEQVGRQRVFAVRR